MKKLIMGILSYCIVSTALQYNKMKNRKDLLKELESHKNNEKGAQKWVLFFFRKIYNSYYEKQITNFLI